LRNRIPEAEDHYSNPETSDDPELRSCKDSGEDLGSDNPESQSEDDIVAAKPYNLLLQSLVTSNKSSKYNPQRRKLDHPQTEEDGIVLEDGEDLANEPEEEEEPDEAIDLGSDNEDPSDPFESHFASRSPSRLASISSPSEGEWEDTKLPKSRLLGNPYLSILVGSEQATGGRRIEGLKDLNFQKLVAEGLTPLQNSLGELVFNYVDVLYGERTLGNAKELRRRYSLHPLKHVLKYVPTQVVDHFILIKTQDPRPSSKEQCPPSKGYGQGNRAQISRLHKAQNPFHTTTTKRLRGSNKCTSRHTTTRVTSSSSLEYLTCRHSRKTKNGFKIHTRHPRIPRELAPKSPQPSLLSLAETTTTSSG